MKIKTTNHYAPNRIELPDQEIIDLYLSHTKSMTQLAEKYNCSISCINRVLKEHNIEKYKGRFVRSEGKLAINVNYFDVIDTHEKSYWLGVITDDASLRKSDKHCVRPNRLSIRLKRQDKYLLELFKKNIGSEHKVSDIDTFDKRTNKTYYSSAIQLYSVQMCQALMDLGVGTNKSYYCAGREWFKVPFDQNGDSRPVRVVAENIVALILRPMLSPSQQQALNEQTPTPNPLYTDASLAPPPLPHISSQDKLKSFGNKLSLLVLPRQSKKCFLDNLH